MKSKLTHLLLSAVICLASLSGCTNDDAVDNRDHGYGYAQFKIYKEASFQESTKASNDKLDFLSDACKIKVTLLYNNTTITQSIVLSAHDEANAEFGLRSAKLKLVTGDYTIQSFVLYDKLDNEVFIEQLTDNTAIHITEGGLTVKNLTVTATERGHVKFTFTKDLNVVTKAEDSKYTFDEIAYVSLSLKELSTSETVTFNNLPTTFDIHFDESGTGYRTSTLVTDTIPPIKAGKWRVTSYTTRNKEKAVLEVASTPSTDKYNFVVTDNATTEATVPIKMNESAEYIKDYLALKEIWDALDGPNWAYHGQSYTNGANWDFNKDVDLWGDQPGVQLHSNGRVALINISEFGIKGAMPSAIGQFSELIELYIGSHNDNNDEYIASTVGKAVNGTLAADRMALGKEYLDHLYGNPYRGLSTNLRRAYVELNKPLPGGLRLNDDRKALWETDVPETKADTQFGTICNELTSLPPEIGKLKNLQTFDIANSTITSLPDEMEELTGLTDLEVYNCPKMTKFPMSITQLPALVSLNISQNKQWSASEIYKGLDALAKGPANKILQLLYVNNDNLEEVPESFNKLTKLGLISLTSNKISKIHPLGKDVHPSQLMYDNNLITEIPLGDDGYFCGFVDMETLSFSYNKLTKVPNMFSGVDGEDLGTANFSYNDITGFDDESNFKTMQMTQINLEGNDLTEYPAVINRTESRILQVMLKGNKISTFPEKSFTGKYSYYLESLDLSYNRITALPGDFDGVSLPYLNGIDLSNNGFSAFPYRPLDCSSLTVMIIRAQRDAQGNRCLKEWPSGISAHKGLRALYIGSNDLRKINDQTISYLIYYLDIADNPNIVFDASDICYYIKAGAFNLFYDRTQDIRNCDYLDLDN